MTHPAIQIEGLAKQYLIGASDTRYRTLRETIADVTLAPVRRLRSVLQGKSAGSAHEPFWALRDLNLEVQPGEVVGIIGRNGAGKTTLLKILSRITPPTRGSAKIQGRVGSLLEVGTGFHPELSGRENVFLNGAILGMPRAEIERKFDQIVAFAEVDRFIDTPVKRYSSGMYVRLAFAVAAHLEPEVLLVDEVLAVGDASFQKKCLGKIGDIAGRGRTVLFVSHNMAAVRALCTSTLWLDDGRVQMIGPTDDVVSEYLSRTNSSLERHRFSRRGSQDKVELLDARLEQPDGRPLDQIWVSSSFQLRFCFAVREPQRRLHLSLEIWNQDGICVFASISLTNDIWGGKPFEAGRYESLCTLPPWLFNAGLYSARVHFVKDSTTVVCSYDDVLRFEVGDVIEDRGAWFGKWPGVVRPRLKWATRRSRSADPGRG